MKPKNSGLFARSVRGRAVKAGALLSLGLVAGAGLRIGIARPGVENIETSGTARSVLSAPDTGIAREEKAEPSKEVAAALAVAGGVPTMAEVLDAVGLDLYVKLARFLAVASGDDCRRISEGFTKRGVQGNPTDSMISLRWAEVDPLGALEANPKSALWGMGKSDPEAAIAEAIRRGDPFLGAEVVRAIAQEDAARGAEMLRLHPEFSEWNAWEGMVSSLAKTDLRAAAEYALAHGVNLEGTLKRWTEKDPDGALAFALSQSDARDRAKALREVLGKVSEENPERALEMVRDLPPGGMRHEVQQDLIKRAAQSDPAMAKEWARALPHENERLAALRAIGTEICYSEPDAALGLFLETFSAPDPDDPFASGFTSDETLGRALAASQPAATLSALAAGAGHENAVASIAGIWVRNDPEQASAWIGSQPEGAARNAMVNGLVNGMLIDSNPDFGSAAIWALSLPPGESERGSDPQGQLLHQIFRNWLRRDRAAALEAMAHEGMPPQVRSLYDEEVGTPR